MSADDEIKGKLKLNAAIIDQFIDENLQIKTPATLYEASRHLIMAGGKRLRPYLVMKSCELVCGNVNNSVPFAAALEVLHNFTLIHDDIMDNDDFRRGVPTVHTKWGVPIGVASGDLLFSKVYDFIIDAYKLGKISGEGALECIERVTDASIAICEGQVLDTSFPSMENVTEEDYIEMVGGKTSALFKACAEIGGIVGGASKEQIKNLGQFAWDSGIAFQIVDDILGVISDKKTLGKPIGSDLREGKKTIIIIYALQNGTEEENKAIRKVLGVRNVSEENILVANEALKSSGGLDYARGKAENYVKQAYSHLDTFRDCEAKEDLKKLIHYFTERLY